MRGREIPEIPGWAVLLIVLAGSWLVVLLAGWALFRLARPVLGLAP